MLFQRPTSQWTETRIRSFFDRIVAVTSHHKPDEAAPLLTNRTRRLPSIGESQLVSHWVLRHRFSGEAPPPFCAGLNPATLRQCYALTRHMRSGLTESVKPSRTGWRLPAQSISLDLPP